MSEMTYAQAVSSALREEILKDPTVFVIGEDIGLFGGAMLTNGDDFYKLNIIIRKTITAMSKKMVDEHGKSDFRDWEFIHSWAEDVIKKIT